MSAPKPKLRVTPLTDQISEALHTRIARGEIAPGSRLPTEQELSAEFGVSRTVVREAISRLKSEGLVETRQGAGAFVRQDRLGMPFRIAPDSVESAQGTVEILELRLAVESEAAALAAERASGEQLQAIRTALDAVRAAFERGGDGIDEDLQFHRAIAQATNNSTYVALAEFLERYVRRQIEITGGASDRASRREDTHDEHARIAEAIERRNAEAARASAREHFRRGIERFERTQPH
jgi:DNA-binding FadR family transcriptional regulator